MTKYLVHFAFVVAGVAHVVRGGRLAAGDALAAFVAGIALNAAYGVAQLGAPGAARLNLDRALIGPMTFGQGGVGGINVYGGAQTVAAARWCRSACSGSTRWRSTPTTSGSC